MLWSLVSTLNASLVDCQNERDTLHELERSALQDSRKCRTGTGSEEIGEIGRKGVPVERMSIASLEAYTSSDSGSAP